MIEKFYRRIIDGVPTAVIVVDSNLKAVFTNTAFRALFPSGLTKGNLGKVTCCSSSAARCGRDVCRGCSLFDVFEDAFYSNMRQSRRIYQKVCTDGFTHDVSY